MAETTIKKEDNNLVMSIPLTQKSYDAVGELIGQVPNLIGVIIERKNGLSEYTINQLIDLGYKSSIQTGAPIICLESREELEEACKELGLQIDEMPMCAICDEPLYSTFTISKKGEFICFNCENNE